MGFFDIAKRRIGAYATGKLAATLLIQRADAIIKEGADFSELDGNIRDFLQAFGVKACKRLDELHTDASAYLDLSEKMYDGLPSMNMDAAQLSYDVLHTWIHEDQRFELVAAQSYFCKKRQEPTYTHILDKKVPRSMTYFVRFQNDPLIVTLTLRAYTHISYWSIEILSERAAEFQKELQERINKRLLLLYKGKAINAALEYVTIKRVTREELTYPAALENSIDEQLLALQRWSAPDSLVKRWGNMLIGAPGTGKTTFGGLLAAKRSAECTFLYVPAKEITTPEALTKVFEMARLLAPTIIQIDDVDLIAGARGQEAKSEKIRLTSALMEALEGLEDTSRIFTILTTNDPSLMDAAITDRPGRIWSKIVFDGFGECLPKLLVRHAATYQLDLDIETARLACQKLGSKKTSVFTPDGARNVCGGLYLTRRETGTIGYEELLRQLETVYNSFHNAEMNRSRLATPIGFNHVPEKTNGHGTKPIPIIDD